jgi:hypothetical protein
MRPPRRSRRFTSREDGRLVSVDWFRRYEFERAVWSARVVVVDEDAKHMLEMAAIEDQQPVETLSTDGADVALGERVRLRRAHRCLDGPDAFAGEDGVEATSELGEAVADQEAEL